MVSEITANQSLMEACKEFKIKELHVFGSAVSLNIESVQDLDFLVIFERDGYKGAFGQFMGFKERLEEIFKKPVDLITYKKFRNPLFQEEIERTKELIYAA